MWSIRSWTSRPNSTARWIGRRTPATVAVRQAPVGAAGMPAPSRPASVPPPTTSVTLVPLLAPRVAQVVVTVLLPETGLVTGHQGELADPLGALPEVQVRHQRPDRAPVLDRQRLAVELPAHPGLPAGDVLEGQVGGV